MYICWTRERREIDRERARSVHMLDGGRGEIDIERAMSLHGEI